MTINKWYKIYGVAKGYDKEYLLAEVSSPGNTRVVIKALKYAYKDLRTVPKLT